jgi:hypothetical protein
MNEICAQEQCVVDKEWFFSGPDPTFQLVSDPKWIFSNILNINFTIVFPLVTI